MENKNTKILYEFKFNFNKKRWKNWYIIVFSIIIWIVIWWFLTRQYGLSLIIMLFSWVYILLENNIESNNVYVRLTDLWIFLNDIFYPYDKIKFFSIIYDNENPIFLRLYIFSTIKFLDIDIDKNNVSNIKNILWNYIEEKKDDKLTNIDKIIRFLKL